MTNQRPVYLWKKAPFTRLLPALVVGILIEHYLHLSIAIILSSITIAALLLFTISWQKAGVRYFSLPLTGFLWIIMLCSFGMAATWLGNIRNDTSWHGYFLDEAQVWEVKILSQPEEKEKSYKVIAEVLSGYVKDSAMSVKGKVLLYFSKDSNSIQISQGDILYIRNKFQPINNTGNPGSFDYRKYMQYQHVFYQAFLYANDWQQTGIHEVSMLDRVIHSSLKYENDLFHKYLKGDQVIALASALMTGNRSELDRDLVQAYSNAGVVHIMSISGLHLGLIYIFLIQFAKVIPGVSKNKIARAVLVLCGIWFFAVLTGCSPSVMRSAVMFTCLHIGQLTNRKVLTYNFWSASAFLLLIFDPMLLWNVGFQLSYTAVLGILVAQRPIYNWVVFDNKLVDYMWQLISVSLSAQLFTLPICLYYFHQVPLLFIVANLAAIPLSSIGLWLSLVLVLTGWIPYVPVALGAVISLVFGWLNDFINYLDSFVFTVWNGIFLNLVETITFLLLISFATYWLLHKSRPALKMSIICMLIMALSFGYSYWITLNQQKLIVYNINATTAIDVISGRKYFEIMDNENSSESPAIRIARQYFGSEIKDTISIKVDFGNNEFYPLTVPIVLIKSAAYLNHLPKNKIHLKALILANSPKIKLADLNNVFDPDIYIFAPSNKRSQVEKWKKECEELHLRSHDISMQGAMVMDY